MSEKYISRIKSDNILALDAKYDWVGWLVCGGDEGIPSQTGPSRLLVEPVPNGEHFGVDGVGLDLARLRPVGDEAPYLAPPANFRRHWPARVTLPSKSVEVRVLFTPVGPVNFRNLSELCYLRSM